MADKPDRSYLKDFGVVKEFKTYTTIAGKNKKLASVTKRRVTLEDYKPEYGSNVRIFTEEEIKTRHLGKTKCIMKFKTDDELKSILSKYFVEEEKAEETTTEEPVSEETKTEVAS